VRADISGHEFRQLPEGQNKLVHASAFFSDVSNWETGMWLSV
jgi:hypothetical protein